MDPQPSPPPPLPPSPPVAASTPSVFFATTAEKFRAHPIMATIVLFAGFIFFIMVVSATTILCFSLAEQRRKKYNAELSTCRMPLGLLLAEQQQQLPVAATALSRKKSTPTPGAALLEELTSSSSQPQEEPTPPIQQYTSLRIYKPHPLVVPALPTTASSSAAAAKHALASTQFGVFRVTRERSAVLNISKMPSSPDYFEIVVYRYPEWIPVYFDTNARHVAFDFLPFGGTYTLMIFTFNGNNDHDQPMMQGSLTLCQNENRPKPEPQAHRFIGEKNAELRAAMVTTTIESLAPFDTVETMRIYSHATTIWPTPVLTRIETLRAFIPRSATEIYVVLPSFGYIIAGGDEHLSEMIHESNFATYYRAKAVTVPPGDDGGDGGGGVIELVVAYPNMSPDSHLAPVPTLFIFTPPPSPQQQE